MNVGSWVPGDGEGVRGTAKGTGFLFGVMECEIYFSKALTKRNTRGPPDKSPPCPLSVLCFRPASHEGLGSGGRGLAWLEGPEARDGGEPWGSPLGPLRVWAGGQRGSGKPEGVEAGGTLCGVGWWAEGKQDQEAVASAPSRSNGGWCNR